VSAVKTHSRGIPRKKWTHSLMFSKQKDVKNDTYEEFLAKD